MKNSGVDGEYGDGGQRQDRGVSREYLEGGKGRAVALINMTIRRGRPGSAEVNRL